MERGVLEIAPVNPPILQVSHSQQTEKEKAKYSLSKGDLLFNRTNSAELVGKSAVFDGSRPALFASYLIRFRLSPEKADPHFVCAYINSRYGRVFIEANMARAIGQVNISASTMRNMPLPLPQIEVQQEISARLQKQWAEVGHAQLAVEAQRTTYDLLVHALLRESLASTSCQQMFLNDCLREVIEGIGESWAEFPVLGATRAGLALAKEPVGKKPGRYKPVVPGTIFYNPMRILLGSIAMIDDEDKPGITSPDYVVVRGVEGKLHPRWFYHWFRSAYGAEFIKSLTRGAVRERLMFKRLAPVQISVPDWPTQLGVATKLQEIKLAKVLLEQRLAEIERLPAALLREAFQISNN